MCCTKHKKSYCKASIDYVVLKLRFVEPLPLCYALFLNIENVNARCLIVTFFMNIAPNVSKM